MKTSQEVKEALAEMFPQPEYAFLTEVSNATGANIRGRADALAMSLWPSRGLELIGFEIKVSRSDWVREKNNPVKAELIASYCHRWYLVASTSSFVAQDEVPPLWGYICPKGDSKKLSIEKPAPLQTSVKPLDYPFLASLLRSSCKDQEKYILRSEIANELQKSMDLGIHYEKENSKREIERINAKYENLNASVNNFRNATGIDIFKHQRFEIGNLQQRIRQMQQICLNLSDDFGVEADKLLAMERESRSEMAAIDAEDASS
jgi:hypothetical protein